MRWANAPTYTACVIDAVGSAGVQSHACNEFGEFVAPAHFSSARKKAATSPDIAPVATYQAPGRIR